jgi:GNAT superfamily N-acetyltransferase
MLARLDDEWRTGVQLFDQPGEMLLAAFEDGALHGIGGMTLCPTIAGALRMRRFYVAAAARRRGVARALARALLEQVPLSVATLTVHAGSPAAASFWESLDFRAAGCAGISHRRAVAAGEAMLSAMTSPAVPP